MGFIALRYLCRTTYFCHFYLKFWARKIALKTSKNGRNSAKFERQKLPIKIWKIMFCDTYTQRHKTPLRNFPGKKTFRKWWSTLLQSRWGPSRACKSFIFIEFWSERLRYIIVRIENGPQDWRGGEISPLPLAALLHSHLCKGTPAMHLYNTRSHLQYFLAITRKSCRLTPRYTRLTSSSQKSR